MLWRDTVGDQTIGGKERFASLIATPTAAVTPWYCRRGRTSVAGARTPPTFAKVHTETRRQPHGILGSSTMRSQEMARQIAIFSTSSREISSLRRSYSFVVRGEAWLAIVCACSSNPLFF